MKTILSLFLISALTACSQNNIVKTQRDPSSLPLSQERINATNDFKDDLLESLTPLLNKTIICDDNKTITLATRNPNRYFAFEAESKNVQNPSKTLRVFTLSLIHI